MKFSVTQFTIKQGDLDPDIAGAVQTDAGVAQDLTGATVTFYMRASRAPSTVKINGAAATLVTPASGLIKYSLQGTDTNTPGTYQGEFRVVPASGDSYRVPTDGYLAVIIEEKTG